MKKGASMRLTEQRFERLAARILEHQDGPIVRRIVRNRTQLGLLIASVLPAARDGSRRQRIAL